MRHDKLSNQGNISAVVSQWNVLYIAECSAIQVTMHGFHRQSMEIKKISRTHMIPRPCAEALSPCEPNGLCGTFWSATIVTRWYLTQSPTQEADQALRILNRLCMRSQFSDRHLWNRGCVQGQRHLRYHVHLTHPTLQQFDCWWLQCNCENALCGALLDYEAASWHLICLAPLAPLGAQKSLMLNWSSEIVGRFLYMQYRHTSPRA